MNARQAAWQVSGGEPVRTYGTVPGCTTGAVPRLPWKGHWINCPSLWLLTLLVDEESRTHQPENHPTEYQPVRVHPVPLSLFPLWQPYNGKMKKE